MRKPAILVALALPLLACQAQAGDPAKPDATERAVADIMCANTAEDRQAAISALGNALDDFQPRDDEDTRSRAVDGAIDAFVDTGCDQATRPQR